MMKKHRFVIAIGVALVALISFYPGSPFAETEEVKEKQKQKQAQATEEASETVVTKESESTKSETKDKVKDKTKQKNKIKKNPDAAEPVELEDGTVPPKPVHMVPADYPEDARKAAAGGMVKLEVAIDKDGKVSKVTVLEGVEDFPSLDQAAVKAAEQWLFKPATKEGEPIEIKIVIPFKFALE